MSRLQKKSNKNHPVSSLALSCVSAFVFSAFVRKKKKNSKLFSLSLSSSANKNIPLLFLAFSLSFCSLFLGVNGGILKVVGVGGVCVPKSTLSHSHSLTLTL